MDGGTSREGGGARLTEEEVRRRPHGRLAQAKVASNYVDSNVAKWRAEQDGCQDGIILDHTGLNVAEFSVSNIICLFDDTIVSPHPSSGALNGITKQTIHTVAYELYGLPTTDQSIPVRRVSDARLIIY